MLYHFSVIDDLIANISQIKNKTISVLPVELSQANVFGFTISLQDRYQIFYEKNTIVLHQKHIILHELGHIFLNHLDDKMCRIHEGGDLNIADTDNNTSLGTLLCRNGEINDREIAAEQFAISKANEFLSRKSWETVIKPIDSKLKSSFYSLL